VSRSFGGRLATAEDKRESGPAGKSPYQDGKSPEVHRIQVHSWVDLREVGLDQSPVLNQLIEADRGSTSLVDASSFASPFRIRSPPR